MAPLSQRRIPANVCCIRAGRLKWKPGWFGPFIPQDQRLLHGQRLVVRAGGEVRADVALVELHAFDEVELGLKAVSSFRPRRRPGSSDGCKEGEAKRYWKYRVWSLTQQTPTRPSGSDRGMASRPPGALGLFDGDDAVLADLVHGIGQQLADLFVRVGADGADLGDLGARLDLGRELGDLLDRDGHGLVDALLDLGGVGDRGGGLEALAEDRLGEDGEMARLLSLVWVEHRRRSESAAERSDCPLHQNVEIRIEAKVIFLLYPTLWQGVLTILGSTDDQAHPGLRMTIFGRFKHHPRGLTRGRETLRKVSRHVKLAVSPPGKHHLIR